MVGKARENKIYPKKDKNPALTNCNGLTIDKRIAAII
jgi:hypothetical protein